MCKKDNTLAFFVVSVIFNTFLNEFLFQQKSHMIISIFAEDEKLQQETREKGGGGQEPQAQRKDR